MAGLVVFAHLLGVCPASEAADISLYRGSPVLSTGRGEQEQSNIATKMIGITAILALGRGWFCRGCVEQVHLRRKEQS